MNTNYYQYNNNIYKYRPHHNDFLLMTCWDKQENQDRRIPESMLNINDIKKIKQHDALRMINEYWDANVRTWEYNGNKYDNSCAVSNNQPVYKFTHNYVNRDGKDCSYSFDYILVWHQGHIYWAYAHTHYYPQMELQRFIDINTEPSINDFVKWTNVNHCRAIKNVKTGKLI